MKALVEEANQSGVDLGGANLRWADLSRAIMTEANLSEAGLTGTIGIIAGGAPNGWTTFGWLRGDVLSIRVGCHEMRLDEGREYWTGKEDRREVLAALDYIEAVAKARGWKTEE